MTTKDTGSEALFARAKACIPGGVNSPVRAFRGVGGTPRFMRRGKGSRVWDEDGAEYVDMCSSWGPLIAGHAHPRVIEAIMAAVQDGATFGAPTRREVLLAEKVCSMVPGVAKLRLVSTGTEATMTAVRVARAATSRDYILKFDGCYHGHSDAFLIQAGSGATTLGRPDSPGVPEAVASLTLRAAFNDLASVERVFAENPSAIAAVIVEPVAANMGVVLPKPGFLQGLRDLCDHHGAVLIFDEVITGFRLARGGAQEWLGVTADLVTFGKILGGGMPLGAFGGKAALMDLVSPAGPVYQAGTLSGNPAAVAAGLATLDVIDSDPRFYERLDAMTADLAGRLAACSKGLPLTINRVGSMFTPFFAASPVFDYASAKKADAKAFGLYFHRMLEHGVYAPPSQFEAWFVSAAHTPEDLDRVADSHERAMAAFLQAEES